MAKQLKRYATIINSMLKLVKESQIEPADYVTSYKKLPSEQGATAQYGWYVETWKGGKIMLRSIGSLNNTKVNTNQIFQIYFPKNIMPDNQYHVAVTPSNNASVLSRWRVYTSNGNWDKTREYFVINMTSISIYGVAFEITVTHDPIQV